MISRTDPVILFSKTSGNVQRVQQKKAVRPATSSKSEKHEKIRFAVNYNCEFCSRKSWPARSNRTFKIKELKN